MHHRFNPIAFALALLVLGSVLAAQTKQQQPQRDYEAERRQLANLRREVQRLEDDVRQIESQIEDRKRQLAEAPKTIVPAEQALAEADKRQDKAKTVMPEFKKKLDAADVKVVAVLKSLKSQYDGAAQLDATETKLAEARARLDEARKAGVEKLKNDADYKAAKKRVETAQTRVNIFQEEREQGKGSSTDLVDAATELLRYQSELNQLESKVLTADERFKKAKTDAGEAEKTLTYLRSQMSEKLKNHPEYAGAEAALAEARTAFAAATKEMAEAGKARAAATGELSKLKAQVKEFERDTQRLGARKQSLEAQARIKARRADDYARQISRP